MNLIVCNCSPFRKLNRKIFGKFVLSKKADRGWWGTEGPPREEKKHRQIKIPEVVRKLMDEHLEVKLFINCLLEENRLLEENNHELERRYLKLRKMLDKLIGSVYEKKSPIIRIRTIRQDPKPSSSGPYHKGVARPAPKEVDGVIQVKTKKCPDGHQLGNPIEFEVRYVEDIVPAKVVKKKYVAAKYWCKRCGRKVLARLTDALPHEHFGINLMLLVSFMRICGITL